MRTPVRQGAETPVLVKLAVRLVPVNGNPCERLFLANRSQGEGWAEDTGYPGRAHALRTRTNTPLRARLPLVPSVHGSPRLCEPHAPNATHFP